MDELTVEAPVPAGTHLRTIPSIMVDEPTPYGCMWAEFVSGPLEGSRILVKGLPPELDGLVIDLKV